MHLPFSFVLKKRPWLLENALSRCTKLKSVGYIMGVIIWVFFESIRYLLSFDNLVWVPSWCLRPADNNNVIFTILLFFVSFDIVIDVCLLVPSCKLKGPIESPLCVRSSVRSSQIILGTIWRNFLKFGF